MSNVLKIRDENGNFVGIPAITGAPGKSAYEQAVEGGYPGTEEEFIQTLATLAGVSAIQLADANDYEEHIENKNNPHKSTAAQVGALPTTGGIMSGPIKWNDGKQHIIGQSDGNLIIQNYKQAEYANDDFLAFHNTLPLQSVLRIYRNGQSYSVYGEHNKPTASDIGAVSKNGDVLTGHLDFNNKDAYFAVQKVRTVGDVDHKLTLGVASTGGSVLEHYSGETLEGRMELDGDGIRFRKGNEQQWSTVFGEHNKPTKSYTGNGGNQTIQIGGLGIVAWLVSSNGLQGYVSKNGFMGMNSNGQASNQVASFITFENGVLTLNNGGLCNASGIEYTVQVL
jgi:hypothetical protein